MKRLLFLLLPLVGSNTFAQKVDSTHMLGVVFNDSIYNSQPIQSMYEGSWHVDMPAEASLKKYAPMAGNQGKLNSSVGWSVCYSALTILHAERELATNRKSITDKAFSAPFIYNQMKVGAKECNTGVFLPDFLNYLNVTGSCNSAQFNPNTCNILPNDTLRKEASMNATRDFEALFTTFADAATKIQKTKMSIAEGKPVIIAMSILESFKNISGKDPVWHPESGQKDTAGAQSLTVVGYDDKKGAFEVMNSWGDNWGDNGFCWVKYEDYGRFCKYAYNIYLARANRTNIYEKLHYSAELSFMYKPQGSDKYQPAKVTYNAKETCYETDIKFWSVGQQFQLLAKSNEKEQYIYVFRIAADNKVSVLFPRAKEENKDFGFSETPLVSFKSGEVLMPSPDKTLTLKKSGTDYIVMFVAKAKIAAFEEYIIDVKKNKDNGFIDDMNRFFRKRLMHNADVKFNQNKMAFEHDGVEHDIVPVILKLKSIDPKNK